MKEIEAFAKALSLGMKALAKMIETAADQLEEQLQAKPGAETEQPPHPQEKTGKRARGKKAAPGKPDQGSDRQPDAVAPAGAEDPAPRAKKPARKKTSEKKKPARKPSDTETVYLHIRSAGEPVHLDEIQRLTGFEKRKLHNIIHRLKNSGRIRIVDKAVYTAD